MKKTWKKIGSLGSLSLSSRAVESLEACLILFRGKCVFD